MIIPCMQVAVLTTLRITRARNVPQPASNRALGLKTITLLLFSLRGLRVIVEKPLSKLVEEYAGC